MSEVEIHPSAIIHPSAELGVGVKVGPYTIIGPNVKIGDRCELASHVTIEENTVMGKENRVFQYTNIGNAPQDISYKGEPTKVLIGEKNIFREFSSIHRASMKEEGVTTIGSNNFFMSYVHIAHDCIIGNEVLFVNSVQCAGHVKISDKVRISGSTNISQFVSVGKGAFIGGDSTLDRDIPDYCTAYGNRVRLKGINIIGLKRAGYSKQMITEVVDFYRTMEASALSPRAFVNHPELMEEFSDNEIIDNITGFIKKSEIGIAPFWD